MAAAQPQHLPTSTVSTTRSLRLQAPRAVINDMLSWQAFEVRGSRGVLKGWRVAEGGTEELRGIDDVRRWDTREKSQGGEDKGSPEAAFRWGVWGETRSESQSGTYHKKESDWTTGWWLTLMGPNRSNPSPNRHPNMCFPSPLTPCDEGMKYFKFTCNSLSLKWYSYPFPQSTSCSSALDLEPYSWNGKRLDFLNALHQVFNWLLSFLFGVLFFLSFYWNLPFSHPA